MEDNKKNKVVKFFRSLPLAWFNAFISAFIVVIVVEIGYLIYKMTGEGSFFVLNFVLIKVFITGLIYLLILYAVVYFADKYMVPMVKERREKRKKEFFEELKKELTLKK